MLTSKKMIFQMKFFAILLLGLAGAESANILVVIPFTANSHYVMQRPIGLELARKGHNVTVITAYEEDDHPANYHQIVTDKTKVWNFLDSERPNLFTLSDMSATDVVRKIAMHGTYSFTESLLISNKIQAFLAQNVTFDIVIAEQFYLEALYMLAHKYGAPLVLISTFGNIVRHNFVTGNPMQFWSLPHEITPVSEPASFQGRLKTLYVSVYEYFWWRLWYLPKHETLAKEYIPDLPQPVPSLYELQKSVSLMLINSHFTSDYPVAYLPNIVEVGGLHVTDVKNNSLPKDLQRVLDSAVHGVVYVNFGSNIQSTELPEDKRKALINVFRNLKQTVIMKWEDDTLENQPKNLYLKKWLPQSDILAHPNVKVFVSHGGLIGTQEAIHNGVPIIGMPIFADQYNNVLQVENEGIGKLLNFNDLNKNNFETILKEFLNDNKFKEKAVEFSKRFKDRPMKALDTAIYWIEYVLRYKGADHIKNPAMKLSWIVYYNIDLTLFVMVIVSLCLYVLLRFIVISRRILWSNVINKCKRKIKSS